MALLDNLKIIDEEAEATMQGLANNVPQAALNVHQVLGGGCDIDLYRQCMFEELKQSGMQVLRNVSLPLKYRELSVGRAMVADFIINDETLVLIRTVQDKNDCELELRSCLKLSGKAEGFLFNFRIKDMREGILHATVQKGAVLKPETAANEVIN